MNQGQHEAAIEISKTRVGTLLPAIVPPTTIVEMLRVLDLKINDVSKHLVSQRPLSLLPIEETAHHGLKGSVMILRRRKFDLSFFCHFLNL